MDLVVEKHVIWKHKVAVKSDFSKKEPREAKTGVNRSNNHFYIWDSKTEHENRAQSAKRRRIFEMMCNLAIFHLLLNILKTRRTHGNCLKTRWLSREF